MKIDREIDLSHTVPPHIAKESDLIFNNRPTQEDVNKAKKDNKLIILLLEVPELSCDELIAFSKGYLKGLGIEKSSPIIQSYAVSEIVDYDSWKESFLKNYLSINESYKPWFAPAGFNRGGLERVLEVRRRLTQTQRDGLYNQRPGVNPIATFPGQGIVIFGQKTLQTKQSVLDRVNVRRLMIYVKKGLALFHLEQMI